MERKQKSNGCYFGAILRIQYFSFIPFLKYKLHANDNKYSKEWWRNKLKGVPFLE